MSYLQFRWFDHLFKQVMRKGTIYMAYNDFDDVVTVTPKRKKDNKRRWNDLASFEESHSQHPVDYDEEEERRRRKKHRQRRERETDY